MRYSYDPKKNRIVRQKHGISLKQAAEIFDQVHVIDRRSEEPEQYRAIGWSRGRLCSLIFEIRHDSEGEYLYLVTAWKATVREEQDYAETV